MATVLFSAAIVVGVTVISLVRLPRAVWDVVWAEDGARFLAELFQLGALESLLHPYAGYLHAVPRAIVAASAAAGLETYAVSVTVLSALAVGIVALCVFVCSRDVVPWLPARLALALITAILPLASTEVLGNVANLHWYFLWLAPWLLLYIPRTWLGSGVLAVVALGAALTEIQLVVFLPLILWRFRSVRAIPVRAAMVVGALVQIVTTLAYQRPIGEGARPDIASLIEGYLLNVVLPLGMPDGPRVGALVALFGIGIGVAVAVPFLAAAVYALVKGPAIVKIAVVASLVASVLIWSASYYLNAYPAILYSQWGEAELRGLRLLRYGVVPGMLLAAVIPIAASVLRLRAVEARYSHETQDADEAREARDARDSRDADRISGRLARRAPHALVGATILIMAVASLWAVPRSAGGPSWAEQASDAADQCREAAETEVIIDLSPASWNVALDCEVIVG